MLYDIKGLILGTHIYGLSFLLSLVTSLGLLVYTAHVKLPQGMNALTSFS